MCIRDRNTTWRKLDSEKRKRRFFKFSSLSRWVPWRCNPFRCGWTFKFRFTANAGSRFNANPRMETNYYCQAYKIAHKSKHPKTWSNRMPRRWRTLETGHLFGIHLPPHADPSRIAAELQRSHLSVSLRSDTIRVAPYLYNTTKDMDALVHALKTALK